MCSSSSWVTSSKASPSLYNIRTLLRLIARLLLTLTNPRDPKNQVPRRQSVDFQCVSDFRLRLLGLKNPHALPDRGPMSPLFPSPGAD